jgi:IclR family acetate operon transcriptional repressor
VNAPQPLAPVKSALRTLDVIEFVVSHPSGAIAQEIAAALNIPVSSLSYLLATLAEREYLTRDGRLYRAGPGLARLLTPRDTLPLADRAAPLVRATRGELDETTSFMIRAGWECEALVTEASAQALRYAVDPGQRRPLHALAAGKVLLAALSESDIAEYFAQSTRAAFTPHTTCDEVTLRQGIGQARRDGFAEAREESHLGVCGIAVPVRIGGQIVGCFSVAIPTVRFNAALRDHTLTLLRRCAAALAE